MGQGNADQGAALQVLASQLEKLPAPDPLLFSDVDGAPAPLPAGASDFHQAAAAQLAALRRLAQLLDPGVLSTLVALTNPDDRNFAVREGASGGPRIEELAANDGDPSLGARLLLAAAQYSPCLPLPTPWASEATAEAAEQLLACLASAQEPRDAPAAAGAPTTGSSAGSSQGQAGQVQQLVAGLLPLTLQQLRPVLLPPPQQSGHEGSQAVGDLGQQGSAATFTRCIAGTQLAWLLFQLSGSVLSAALRLALPCLLACLDDPSPCVQLCGLWVLRHCAAAGDPAGVRWQGELLLDRLKSLLAGCDLQVWPAACDAAVAVALAVEGGAPSGKALPATLSQLLAEVERRPSQPSWVAPLLAQLPGICQAMGLLLVPHLPWLLPLLAGCLAAPSFSGQGASGGGVSVLDSLTEGEGEGKGGAPADREQGSIVAVGTVAAASAQELESLRLLALGALLEVVRHTWPRMPAHAEPLWRCLEGAAEAGAQGRAGPAPAAAPAANQVAGAEVVGAGGLEQQLVRKCATALWLCGGAKFQERAAGSRLLQEVELQLKGEA